jgi:outer membrane protein
MLPEFFLSKISKTQTQFNYFCRMTKRIINLLIALAPLSLFIPGNALAQVDDKWDLQRCVDYALKNNITVRQADLQKQLAIVDFQQSRLAQYPTLNFNTNVGYSAGRNQDPTTFSLITTAYTFNNMSLQSSVDLFNWFSKKNTVAVRSLNVQAYEEGVEKAKNDVALNVAVAYLQVLLGREQVKLAESQVALSRSQLESTRKQVEAGKLPEINAANLESILASDSSTLISAITSANQLLLQMKVLLNLDAAMPFDIATPPVERIPVENLADLQPDAVYTLAMANMPQQKVDLLNLKSAQKSVLAAKGALYPGLSLFGSLGNSYNNKAKQIISKSQVNAPVGNVTISGTTYQVFPVTPFDVYNYGSMNYFEQLNQNFRQSIGLSLNVPILGGGSLRSQVQRARLNVKQVELQKEQNSFGLKRDIYKAYYDAVAASQKFNADKKTVETSQRTFDYASKRYEIGLLSSYDLVTSQTNLAKAKSQLLYSQFDYVFKMKLLEFYKGQGLKL